MSFCQDLVSSINPCLNPCALLPTACSSRYPCLFLLEFLVLSFPKPDHQVPRPLLSLTPRAPPTITFSSSLLPSPPCQSEASISTRGAGRLRGGPAQVPLRLLTHCFPDLSLSGSGQVSSRTSNTMATANTQRSPPPSPPVCSTRVEVEMGSRTPRDTLRDPSGTLQEAYAGRAGAVPCPHPREL